MALHGENGENGKIQAAFDLFGVKYTGSDYLSSAIAMNKETSKQFFLANGIPTPKGISMTRATRQDDITKLDLTLPCVVKPCCGGSSIGAPSLGMRQSSRRHLTMPSSGKMSWLSRNLYRAGSSLSALSRARLFLL